MTRTFPKLLLALASAGLAALALWGLKSWIGDQVDMPGVESGSVSAPVTGTGTEQPLAERRARGQPPLEAQRAGTPVFPRSSFVRWPVGADVVSRYYQIDSALTEFDPYSYFRHRPDLEDSRTWGEHPDERWILRTNSLGLRMDEEPLTTPLDLRVLVVGDSHTDGVCNNSEGYPALLEAALARTPGADRAVEVLNAAKGGHSFYNYLGTLERFLPLEPDVFVMLVYGGNDFYEVLELHAFFAGQARLDHSEEYWPLVEAALEVAPKSLSQFFHPLKYFAHHPTQVAAAAWASGAVTEEIRRTCEQAGIELVVVYLPPASDVEWELLRERLDPVRELLEVPEDRMRTLDVLAGAYLDELRSKGVRVLDLRDVFAVHPGPFFWPEDLHINLGAQRLIAGQLAELCGRLPIFAER